jgi:hypothetical protein
LFRQLAVFSLIFSHLILLRWSSVSWTAKIWICTNLRGNWAFIQVNRLSCMTGTTRPDSVSDIGSTVLIVMRYIDTICLGNPGTLYYSTHPK